ncbi:helix-turn-helix domain-containing protein [Cytobacillus praedii]|uniref:helix-turn-helix domain-containing protein n=1 Tax=Cytobacillus praedii TaxID=1742358 RepID=UPI003F7F8D71
MNHLDDFYKTSKAFVKRAFPEYPEVHSLWDSELKAIITLDKKHEILCISLKAFFNCINNLAKRYDLNIKNLSEWLESFEDEIKIELKDYIHEDYQYFMNKTDNNREIIKTLKSYPYIETGSEQLYHHLRDTISKNEFSVTPEDPFPTVVIEDNDLKAIAQLRNQHDDYLPGLSRKEEIDLWKRLTTQAITSMDDLTADIFDIVSLLWMKKAQRKDQMIHFHSDDALNLRNVEGRNNVEGYNTGYRKKERDDIMTRLAALTTIFIRIERDKLRIIESNEAGEEQIDELETVQFNPLFLVDSVTVAYRGNNPVGIYECKIRPGEIMANFLYDSKNSSSYLALKTLEYDPYRQKYHKRLCRFLSWQWRMKQTNNEFNTLYTIGGEEGIIQVMGLNAISRYASRTKEQFENVLERLHKDNVIQEWHYVNWEENIIEQYPTSWFNDYWIKSKIRILPTKEIIFGEDSNAFIPGNKSLNYSELLDELIEPQTKDFNEKEITPQLIKSLRLKRKMNLVDTATELGISHTTLSRYENGKIKSPKKETIQRMRLWINQ